MAEKNRHFWLVQFDACTDMSKLNEMRLICNVTVRYEKPTSKLQLMQCRNCKLFQHSHTSCFRPFRYIKCPNNHLQGECQLPSSSKPYCCNCKGEHPANAPICPYYLRRLERTKGITPDKAEIAKPKTNVQVFKSNIAGAGYISKQEVDGRPISAYTNKSIARYNSLPVPPMKTMKIMKKPQNKIDRLTRIEQRLEQIIKMAEDKGFFS